MKKVYTHYVDSFSGLSKEIWFLALISLINRAGTMVIPFLSLYLTKELNFSESDTGTILAFFGIGSLLGSFLGGKLIDTIGFYKIMIFSLFFTGIGFIGLQYVHSFWGLCFAILGIMTIADMFRPAIFVSLKAYSKPGNQTRSLALIRLAINLGMGIGPTLAGWIIVKRGYDMLFWIDGVTCIIAIIIFYCLVKEQKRPKTDISTTSDILDKNAVYKDKSYWIFIAICFFMGMSFFQLMITMPIYQNVQFGLTEFETGWIMFINVAIIVVFEMPLVNRLEQFKISNTKLIIYASALFALSFYVLIYNFWIGILIVNIIIITLGEMIGFPYTNSYAINRAKEGLEGSYMAMYAMAFSLAHICSSKTGLEIVEYFGHQVNWAVTGTYGVFGVLLSIWLHKRTQKGL
ncbi:MDR family MFS transporter [Kordia zhangzhouensis]|uniref:MDR family MFS transporter n=1 Tax=Kordia zhangzhouensis TaxID=1620405 RepID=UPI0006299052|nr:MFS transporter [Kordia zhangzhouensis]